MLPPPSIEQARVLDHFRAGANIVVTAVAGAGKSTLLLHACSAFPDDEIVILAYNAPLAAEMNELLQAAGLVHATAYTFHSLASQLFRLCPDDNTMFDIVQEAHRGGAQPRKWITPKHLLLDEMQDMRDLYWELLCLAFDLKELHTLICGDPEQMLYDFEQDDPAKLDFLRRPADFFCPGEWVFERLSVSFRLTPPVATLANAVKEGQPLVAGNVGQAPAPLIVTCGLFEWTAKLLPIVRTWLEVYPPSKIAILARTVRTAHPAVRTFVNNMVAAGFPLYVHGVDAAHARVRQGKITVATYYAAKGLTFEACITLGAAEGVEANPMYVAVSRSRCRQVVVLDRMRPPKRIIDGLRGRAVQALTCSHTKQLITHGYTEKELSGGGVMGLNDVTAWQPRGRAPEVHAAIGNTVISLSDVEALSPECFVEFGDIFEEVSDVYVLASLMCEEWRRTGRCERLMQILNPKKASITERTKRAREGDGTRLVDCRTCNDELFPDNLRSLVRAMHAPDSTTSEPLRWCAAAVAAIAFGHYHHRAERLLSCLDWIDNTLFTTIRERICSRCLGECGGSVAGTSTVRFDHMIRHIGAHTVTQYRCHIFIPSTSSTSSTSSDERSSPSLVAAPSCSGGAAGATTWLLTFAEHIGPNTRVRACVPAAVSDEVQTCCVLNVRTGETQTYNMTERRQLRQRMDLVERIADAAV